MNSNKIRISCLPVAGKDNPYQFLMMEGLKKRKDLEVLPGKEGKIIGIIYTCFAQRPDYIHFDWLNGYYFRRNLFLSLLASVNFFLQIFIAKYLFGCKIVWTVHNIIPHDAKYIRFHNNVHRLFARSCIWIRVFQSSSVIRCSSLLKIPIEKLRIIPEGSYINYYPNTVSSTEARKLLNIKDDAFLLLFIGTVKPYKGILDLIHSFINVSEKNWVLLIVGRCRNRKYENKIKECLSDRIIFNNQFVPEEKIQNYLNAANIVVLPFREIENSGSAILAMSFKKAVIAPRKGVLSERLEKQNKLLYIKNIEEGLEKLKMITQEELIAIGKDNYNEVQKYSWEDFSKLF
jgi:glycosyltransferase involved in cell wall biosynthesis